MGGPGAKSCQSAPWHLCSSRWVPAAHWLSHSHTEPEEKTRQLVYTPAVLSRSTVRMAAAWYFCVARQKKKGIS